MKDVLVKLIETLGKIAIAFLICASILIVFGKVNI